MRILLQVSDLDLCKNLDSISRPERRSQLWTLIVIPNAHLGYQTPTAIPAPSKFAMARARHLLIFEEEVLEQL